jgi:hypothetical protein
MAAPHPNRANPNASTVTASGTHTTLGSDPKQAYIADITRPDRQNLAPLSWALRGQDSFARSTASLAPPNSREAASMGMLTRVTTQTQSPTTANVQSNAPAPETTCQVVATVGAALGGYAAGAALAKAGPVGLAAGKALGGYAGGKLADYACKRVIEWSTPASAASGKVPPEVVLSSQVLAPNSATTPAADHVQSASIVTAGATATAKAIVRDRPSPDYRGHEGAYQIHPGDTLSAIAKAKGLALEQLLASNPQIADANIVRSGQWIHLPEHAAGHAVQASARLDTPLYSPVPSSPPLPQTDRQTSALANLLTGGNRSFDVLTENSGRIAVMDHIAQRAAIVENNGSIQSLPLKDYLLGLTHHYTAQITGGHLNKDAAIFVLDHQAGRGAVLEGPRQGVVFDSRGAVFVDGLGNSVLTNAHGRAVLGAGPQWPEAVTFSPTGIAEALPTHGPTRTQVVQDLQARLAQAEAPGPLPGPTRPLTSATAMQAAEAFAQRLQLTTQDKDHFMQAVQDRWQQQNPEPGLQLAQKTAGRHPLDPVPVVATPSSLRPLL